MIGMPWEPTPKIDAEDVARVPNPDAAEAEVVHKDPEIPESIARRMYIRKTDIIKYDKTDGCIGCRTTMLGKPLQSYTQACRERIEAHLRETEREGEGREDGSNSGGPKFADTTGGSVHVGRG